MHYEANKVREVIGDNYQYWESEQLEFRAHARSYHPPARLILFISIVFFALPRGQDLHPPWVSDSPNSGNSGCGESVHCPASTVAARRDVFFHCMLLPQKFERPIIFVQGTAGSSLFQPQKAGRYSGPVFQHVLLEIKYCSICQLRSCQHLPAS